MKRNKQLQSVLAKSIDGVLDNSLSTEKASAVAKLANVEVKTVCAEINYLRHRSETVRIGFFEDEV
jgi:hypothetical protein